MYEKQRQRDKQYIRHPKEPEVKKHRYHSEYEIESKPEAYYNNGYDKSDEKPLPPKKKIKRNRRNLSKEENNVKTEEEEDEDESESKTNNKDKKAPPNKKIKNVKTKQGIIDCINK